MGGLEKLGINLPTLIAQLVNFGILFALLYLVAYKPVMRMMDERARKVKDSLGQAESARQEAAQARADAEKRIAEASRQGQEMITRAVQQGEEVRQKALQEARLESEALLGRARADIQRERDGAIAELRAAVADLTISTAEKVIVRSLDRETHRDIIDRALEESATLKRGKDQV